VAKSLERPRKTWPKSISVQEHYQNRLDSAARTGSRTLGFFLAALRPMVNCNLIWCYTKHARRQSRAL